MFFFSGSYLAPLLDGGLITVEATMQWCNDDLNVGDTVGVALTVWLTPAVFAEPSRVEMLSASGTSNDDGSLPLSPLALLFRSLGLEPSADASALADVTPPSANTDVEPAAAEPGVSHGDSDVLPADSQRLGDGGGVTEADAREAGIDGGADGSAVADGEPAADAVSQFQLGEIYRAMQEMCVSLEPAESPKGLRCKLRLYQRQALGWMMRREEGSDEVSADDAR